MSVQCFNLTQAYAEENVFNGKSIRKTSGRLNLRSESSSRFEKGINVVTVNEALDAAASMIAELAGATVRKGIVSAGQLDTSDVEVSSTLADVNRSQDDGRRLLHPRKTVLYQGHG